MVRARGSTCRRHGDGRWCGPRARQRLSTLRSTNSYEPVVTSGASFHTLLCARRTSAAAPPGPAAFTATAAGAAAAAAAAALRPVRAEVLDAPPRTRGRGVPPPRGGGRRRALRNRTASLAFPRAPQHTTPTCCGIPIHSSPTRVRSGATTSARTSESDGRLKKMFRPRRRFRGEQRHTRFCVGFMKAPTHPHRA